MRWIRRQVKQLVAPLKEPEAEKDSKD